MFAIVSLIYYSNSKIKFICKNIENAEITSEM